MKNKLLVSLLFLFVGIASMTAQQTGVSGVVISGEDNQPVIGASVLVVGTTVGVTTDVDGKFRLDNLPASAKELQISFIGFRKEVVQITRGKKMKVV